MAVRISIDVSDLAELIRILASSSAQSGTRVGPDEGVCPGRTAAPDLWQQSGSAISGRLPVESRFWREFVTGA